MFNPDADRFHPRYDFPPYAGPVRAFMIASTPRSGSRRLAQLLWSTGRLGAPAEVFHPGVLPEWMAYVGADQPRDALSRIVARRTSPDGWFGAKLHASHLRTYVEMTLGSGVFDVRGWIFTHRRDRLAQAISLAIAQQTGNWNSVDAQAATTPHYARSAIDDALAEIDAQDALWTRFRAQLDRPTLDLAYEDIVAGPQAAVDAVAGLLSIEGPMRLGPTFGDKQSNQVSEAWKTRYLEGD